MRGRHTMHPRRVKVLAQLVRLDVRRPTVVMDCLAAEPFVMLGDHVLQGGEPFSLVVRLPNRSWLRGDLGRMRFWAEDCRRLEIKLSVGLFGARASISDGRSAVSVDLLSVLGGIGEPRRDRLGRRP